MNGAEALVATAVGAGIANDTFATSSALANLSAIPSQAESSVRLYLGSGYRLGWVCQKPQRRPEGDEESPYRAQDGLEHRRLERRSTMFSLTRNLCLTMAAAVALAILTAGVPAS